jgi:hypothetical protein
MDEPAPPPESWEIVDTWRSIWEAMALAAGKAPGEGVAAHRRWCQLMDMED